MSSNEESKCKKICKKLTTPIMVLSVPVGVTIGIIFIAVNNAEMYSKRNVMYVGLLGELSLLSVRCLSLPIIVICIACGVASLSSTLSQKLGVQYTLYIITTKLFCVILGMCFAVALVPKNDPSAEINTLDAIAIGDQYEDFVRLLFPENVIGMFFRTYTTYSTLPEWGSVKSKIVRGPNFIGIAFISIVCGVVLKLLANVADKMFEVIQSLLRVFLEIMRWLVIILPYCMVSDVASGVMAMDLRTINQEVYIMYLVAMTAGLFCLLIIVYPLIYLATVRKNPFRLMINFGKAMATGFTASSTIPAIQQSIECMEINNNVDRRFTRSLIPIGHTIHLTGKAFQGVVLPIFLANASNVYLNGVDYATILFLGFLVSFAVGPLPCKYHLCSTLLLNGVSMQATDISGMLMLDWIVSRLTTIVDIAGDCVGVAILAHFNQETDDNQPAAAI